MRGIPMDNAKIMEAAKVPIGIGVAVILVSLVLSAINLFAGGTLAGAGAPAGLGVVGIISIAYGLATYLIFLLLFAWAGYRAVNKFGLDVAGAAAVGALSAVAVGIVGLVLNFLVLAVALGSSAATTTASAGATAAVAGIAGIISVLFGLFWIIGSAIVNACVAGLAGLLAKGK